MKEKINISIVQPALVWEDIDANLEMLDTLLSELSGNTELILLPETFSTGFTMHAEKYAERANGKAVRWMQKIAREKNSYVCGSLIIRDGERIFNRSFWVSPDGIEGTYDKRHLFRMGREDQSFTPGAERTVFSLGSVRFLPQICYDLRFPVFCRNRSDYDVLFYLANWPAPRQPVWSALLPARAIENQAFVIGVNRVGVDGEGVDHLGSSVAYDPLGNTLLEMDNRPGVRSIQLDLKWLREFRLKFPVWKDADRFGLEL